MDLLEGEAVELALLGRGAAGTAAEAARDVGAIAEGADEVGVEADEVAGTDDAVARLLEPRVGAAARGEKTAFHPLAAHAEVRVAEEGEELVLADAGAERLMHACHPRLADRDGVVHAGDLVGGFDDAGELAGLLP